MSEKGQVTIPKKLRDRLGIMPGDILEFEEDDGRLIGRRISYEERIAPWVGRFHSTQDVDEFIDEIRGPFEG